MNLTHAHLSIVGSKHKKNEDQCLCVPSLGLFAVADGMSGDIGGGVASELAIRVLEEYFTMDGDQNRDINQVEEKASLFKEAFLAANFTIFQTSIRRPEYIGMGTTLTGAWVVDNRVIIGHVGDSRCYLLRGAEVRLLTRDHVLSPEGQGKGSRDRPSRRLSQCIGFQESIDVEILELPYVQGDVFLLCTDGVSDFVPEQDILRSVQKASRQDEWEAVAREMVKLAKLKGADDDTSVVIFKIGPSSETHVRI